jgi:uncharacterized membrane protein YqjE
MGQPPSPWAPPAGDAAPPLRPMPLPAERYKKLGTTCLVLAILELVYCLWRLVGQLLTTPIMKAERTMLPSSPHGPRMNDVWDAAQELSHRIAPWETARTIPFALATGFLLWIAIRLRRGDGAALFAARKWVFAAFGVIAVSLLIQIAVVVPATMDYQRHVADAMPVVSHGSAPPPLDMKKFMSNMTVFGTVFGLVIGTVFVSVWPVILYVWAGKLIRETSPGAVG